MHLEDSRRLSPFLVALSQLKKHFRTGYTHILPLRCMTIYSEQSCASNRWAGMYRCQDLSVPSYLLLGVESDFLSSVRRDLAHIAATNAILPLEWIEPTAHSRFLRRQGWTYSWYLYHCDTEPLGLRVAARRSAWGQAVYQDPNAREIVPQQQIQPVNLQKPYMACPKSVPRLDVFCCKMFNLIPQGTELHLGMFVQSSSIFSKRIYTRQANRTSFSTIQAMHR